MNEALRKEEIMSDQHAKPETHVEVAVITTSGSWPAEGFLKVPAHQKVRQQLNEAVRELKISDTTGWVAKVNGREIDIERNYIENGLSGQVSIDYGPREGGGGYEHDRFKSLV